jgi:hypothetical protein
MILNSLRLVAETEEFATQDIIPELQRNRDTLESAREKVSKIVEVFIKVSFLI